ncbi:hypothetical protein [Nocardioides euryhalodurans]|uniref:DUF4352 domain-containing protein n=1 Tax=Nocardioides euryhalodurans TaxID=2518370 RepID=A0A4P7GJ11_9ACTN|nr:hypothetical protein [Nocardioides euryhalodurans]QBR91611.1 hypothetical protein EXE57_04525 [Nocardioides euryhalodurans]
MRRSARLIALGLAATLALSACSDDGETPASGSSGESPSASETPYLEVPEGVELTTQGSELEIGQTATVAYEPRQGQIGALDIKVTATEKASFSMFEGWELTKETRSTSPYFVRARITNVGESDLGGNRVPLYIVDGENRLIESSVFTGTFEPCEGSEFPKKFRNGDRVNACMVYLAPDKGELTAVSFRPTQEFDPITWTGELEKAGAGQGGGKNKNKKQGGGQQQGNGNG